LTSQISSNNWASNSRSRQNAFIGSTFRVSIFQRFRTSFLV